MVRSQQPLNLAPLKLEPFGEHKEVDFFSQHELVRLLRQLVQIRSTSGDEADVLNFLTNWLKVQGLVVEHQEVIQASKSGSKPVYNILAHSPGQRPSPVLLTSHVDTVPPHIGWQSRKDDAEFWGRGTVDAKACLVAQIFAWGQLRATDPAAAEQVSFLYVIGEETGGGGMRKANELGLEWQTVIFGEPTDNMLASGHKGLLMLKIAASGKGGHSGYPELAESALDMLLAALTLLKSLSLPRTDKYGETTINVGTVRAGVAANVIAQHAEADIGIRLAASDPSTVKTIITDALMKLDDRLGLDFYGPSYGPVHLDADIPGFQCKTVNYGTDVPHLEGHHKRYLYGPGSILVAHSDREHLNLDDLQDAVQGYTRIMKHALAISR